MEQYILINKVFVLIIDSLSLWLGFRILFSNRNRSGVYFLLSSLSITGWITAGYLCNFVSNLEISFFFCKLNILFVGFFFIFVYLFTLYFPKVKKQNIFLKYFLILTATLFSSVIFLTNIGIIGVKKGSWGNYPLISDFVNYFYGFLILYTLMIFYNLFSDFKKLSKKERIKLFYFIVGVFLFSLFNLIFNVALPLFRRTFKYYQLGDYSAIFLLLMVSIGMVRGKLFGVRVLLVELFIVLLGAMVFSQIFIFHQGWEIIWDVLLFLMFVILGIILLNSISREKQQKEELEKLNKELDKRVKERTKELEEKIEELNKFYRLTIGREMKMIELKEKIEEMEKNRREIDKK